MKSHVILFTACEKDGVKMGEGDVVTVGSCLQCSCLNGQTSCTQDPSCQSRVQTGNNFLLTDNKQENEIIDIETNKPDQDE